MTRQIDEALRRRIVAAAHASSVRRVAVEEELPECHKARCNLRHGDPQRAMGIIQDAVVRAVDEELGFESTTRPDIAEPGDSPEDTAVYVLATLLSRYRVSDAGTFARAAQLMVDAYPALINVFGAARDDR